MMPAKLVFLQNLDDCQEGLDFATFSEQVTSQDV